MKQCKAVIATTHVNRKFIRLTKEALDSFAVCLNDGGRPSLRNHDWSRLVGWISSAEVVPLADGEYALQTIMDVPETEVEREVIGERFRQYIRKSHTETCLKYSDVIETAVAGIQGYNILVDPTSCSLVKPGLLYEIYPEIHKQMNEDGLLVLRGNCLSSAGKKSLAVAPLIPYGKHLLVPHWMWRRGCYEFNSFNQECLEQLRQFASQHSECEVSMALDPDRLAVPGTEASGLVELDYWWGPKFNGDILDCKDGVSVHGSSDEQTEYGIDRSEFWWHTDGAERTFEMEQIDTHPVYVSSLDGIERFIAFYVHTIIDTRKGHIVHFDGAFRAYTKEQWEVRKQTDIRKAGKEAIRVKLFRIDTQSSGFTPEEWIILLHRFYRCNPHLSEYFGYDSDDPFA